MKCAWQACLNLLPVWMRQAVDTHGKDTLQELRLRQGIGPELVKSDGNLEISREVTVDDLQYVINMASRYSPWAATTASQGYITAPGGHRIGMCGIAVAEEGRMFRLREPTSLCIRIARDFPGISKEAFQYRGSVLIIGSPGSGKTTLLRDLIRNSSDNGTGSIAVVDEREEIFPMWNRESCFSTGKRTDILHGCRKYEGILAVLRSMGPECIAVDEITAEDDCRALLHAGWCGVRLMATAHAGCLQELKARPVYRPIVENKLFDTVIVLHKDKSWHAERMFS